ncbi:hypothetical protein BDF21DRAFT_420419 [Thamnidium elegans]|nr:hypothetical protein BDF21DRAFT_420419 [Thamnidium elegans]
MKGLLFLMIIEKIKELLHGKRYVSRMTSGDLEKAIVGEISTRHIGFIYRYIVLVRYF